MTQPAVQVEQIGKQYLLGLREKSHQTFREAIVDLAAAPLRRLRQLSGTTQEGQFWALRDVSFDVPEGEVLGIIGHNGAGKSTLLKILSRITEPTEGRAIVRGRVASLLEVGTGFHPELSGRENVYLNGAVLGMSRAEIDRKFDEIVDFAGVEQFLDTPIKRYSSGMKVRLAFAVAAHLEPEILIIDEVLAVGDQEFQSKCLGKMNDVAHSGRTVLFVSHNMAAVEALCSRGLLLHSGGLVFSGAVEETISRHMRTSACQQFEVDLHEHPHRIIDKCPAFRKVRLTDDRGATLEAVELGAPLTFELHLKSPHPLPAARLGIHVYDSLGRRVVTCHSSYQSRVVIDVLDELIVRCRMDSCRLMPARYSLVLGLAAGNEDADRIDPALEFEVLPRDIYATGKLPPARDGFYVPEAAWSVHRADTRSQFQNPVSQSEEPSESGQRTAETRL